MAMPMKGRVKKLCSSWSFLACSDIREIVCTSSRSRHRTMKAHITASAAAAETSPIQNTVRHIGESTSLRSMVASSFQSVPAIGR